MPALGMAQETGRLVRWLKAPGAAVRAGEPLFEVETDKAVMEVEAGTAGWLGDISAAEGEDVPVGRAIARILSEPPADPRDTAPAPGGGTVDPPAAPRPAAAPAAVTAPPDAVAAPDAADAAPPAAGDRPPAVPAFAPAPSGRILASPRLRRLAAEDGLDLGLLVAAGHPQPFHAADLPRLRALSAPRTAPPEPPTGATALHLPAPVLLVTARAGRTAVQALQARFRDEAAVDLDESALWLAFAAAALRAVRPEAGDLWVAHRWPGAPVRLLCNPDLCRLSALQAAAGPDPDSRTPDLVLRDRSGVRATVLALSAPKAPQLTLSPRGDDLDIALVCAPAQLDEDRAAGLVEGLVARLDDPLPFLV